MSRLEVVALHPDARVPTRATPMSAGLDLHACENVVVPSLDFRLVRTGLAMTVPPGTYGRIAPRSSLAMKGVDVFAGVVDRDYTGEVSVLLMNHSNCNREFRVGDRIAQLILERIDDGAVAVAVDALAPSARGEGGFGSTGA